MATCWKCDGKKKVPASWLTPGATGEVNCPACGGNGWIGSPPVGTSPATAPAVTVEAKPGRSLPPQGGSGTAPPQNQRKVDVSAPGASARVHNPLLRSPLFELCPLCRGTTATVTGAMVDGYLKPMPDGSTQKYSGPLPAGSKCPCTASARPGYQEIGMTVAQLERLKAERDLLLLAVVTVRHMLQSREYAIVAFESATVCSGKRTSPQARSPRRSRPGR